MKQFCLLAFGVFCAGCASGPSVPVVVENVEADFPASLLGRAFLAKPVDTALEGEPSEFGRVPTDGLWLTAMQGGYSPDLYRYFLFRMPGAGGRGQLEVVFFNDDFKGFFVTAEIESAGPGGTEFVLRRDTGGGESYRWKTVLRGTVTERDGGRGLAVILESRSKLSMLVPAGKRWWRSRMIFAEEDLPASTLRAAEEISATIQR
jgi:hypothetical protein